MKCESEHIVDNDKGILRINCEKCIYFYTNTHEGTTSFNTLQISIINTL